MVNTKANLIAVELSITNSKALYDSLAAHKDEIESSIGTKLDWRRLDKKKACRILMEKTADLKDSEEQKEQFEWFMENALAFKKAFSKYL